MRARERTRRALRGEATDRPALAYMFLGAAEGVMEAMGTKLGSAYRDAERIAETQVVAAELFGHDAAMVPWGCLTVEAEAFGCSLAWHDDYYPRVTTHPLEEHPDLSLLSDPDPGISGRMPLVLESLARLRERAGEDLFIIAMVVSPFLVASELRGMVPLLTDLVLEPAFAEKLMERVAEGTERYVRAIATQGTADAIMFENAAACSEMMGPAHLERFVMPHQRRLLAAAREASPDLALIEHNCALSPYWEAAMDLDVDAVSIANADPAAAAAEGIAWFGNLDNTRFMLEASPEQIERAARDCVAEAPGPRFVLSTACEVPLRTPVANVAAIAAGLGDL